MKDYFAKYISEKDWLLEEREWDSNLQGVRESQFTLGNGYISSHGVFEENPYDSSPGTYIAGIYDNTGAQVTELVNVPNPLYMKIACQGEKLGMAAMDVLEHKRILDMQKGLLARRTRYSNSKKKRFSYQSLRFFSMHDKHVGAMQIFLTPLDKASTFTIHTIIDTSVMNKGILTEGRKKHFYITNVWHYGNIHYTSVKTFQHGVDIAYACALMVSKGKKRYYVTEPSFKIKAERHETICLTKMFSIYTSRRVNPKRLKDTAIKSIQKSKNYGFERLLNSSIKSWSKKWKAAEVQVKGDENVERALKFNIYHMLICAPEREGHSIGARTLSGEGYRGHIFWDTEIFMLPFYIYTFPKSARNILMYRYRRLEPARQIAKEKGYKGVLFPWESADSGQECTPEWAKDLDGSIIKIHTHEMEHHITSDIAYAVWNYYSATGDEDFLLRYGAEILFETAKFWVSRIGFVKKQKKYEIKHVIGPDEFHVDVDNNAFTNMMARWNLYLAFSAYTKLKAKYPEYLDLLLRKIKLKESQARAWRRIYSCIKVPYSRKKKLVEAFDGYFKKEDVPIKSLDNNFIPLFPEGISPKNVEKTQLVKQADTVMALYLLSGLFDMKEKRRIFNYYEKRTLHKSSLSASTHAIVAAEIGSVDKAFRYFFHSLNADIRNVHGNTDEGIHAASLGGTWQAVVNGFAGMRVKKGTLTFEPQIPRRWQEIAFSIKWRGSDLKISVSRDRVKINLKQPKKAAAIFVRAFEALRQLKPGGNNIFYKNERSKSKTKNIRRR